MKRFNLLIVTILTAFLFIPNANALIAGKADNTVSINENFNDNAAFAGNIVNVDSNIDGINFTAGNSVNVKGSSDYAFIAGNSITITDYKTKDLFVAGNTININNADLRSIYVVGSVVTIKGNAKTIYVGGDNVSLDGEYENVIVEATEFTLNGNIKGTLTINDDAKQDLKEGAKVGTTSTYKNPEYKSNINVDPKAFFIGAIVAKLINKAFHFVAIVVLGIIFIALFKKTIDKLDKADSSAGFIFGRFGLGFLGLIAIPVISIILMITVFLLSIGVITLTLYSLALYLAEVVGTYYIAKRVFKNMNNYLSFILTSLIISVITLIPIVGGLVSFFLLCMSLGLILYIIKTEIKGK